jgi:hypothetical protein
MAIFNKILTIIEFQINHRHHFFCENVAGSSSVFNKYLHFRFSLTEQFILFVRLLKTVLFHLQLYSKTIVLLHLDCKTRITFFHFITLSVKSMATFADFKLVKKFK